MTDETADQTWTDETAGPADISTQPDDLGLIGALAPKHLSRDEMDEAIMERLRELVDPELGINVVDLGLIYGIEVDDAFNVRIDMTLTTPACPLTDELEWGAQRALADIATSVDVNWVWLPPWTLDRITDEGRDQLRSIGYRL
jgi:metal-sulfur cluster biosynthetic enzyme